MFKESLEIRNCEKEFQSTVLKSLTLEALWLNSNLCMFKEYMRSHGIYINALDLKSEFIKVSGFSINIQKSNVILHTIKEQLKIKVRKTLSLTIASKNETILGQNLRKCVQDLYIKHHKVC